MTARRERHGLVEHRAHAPYHLASARRVVSLAARQLAGFLDGIRAVEGIVETAPARIGGIERIPRVAERHDQLRTGEPCDLGVDVLRADAKVRSFRNQVAQLHQVRFVRRDVEWLPAPGAMPNVDIPLELVAPLEEPLVDGNELIQQRLEADPEARGVQAQGGRKLLFDQPRQVTGHPQSAAFDVVSVHRFPCQWQAFAGRGQ